MIHYAFEHPAPDTENHKCTSGVGGPPGPAAVGKPTSPDPDQRASSSSRPITPDGEQGMGFKICALI